MDRVRICLLHGFLGRPSDWDFLAGPLKAHSYEVLALDYLNETRLTPTHSLIEFGRNLNELMREMPPAFNILVGYSLGGRLALHAFQADPSLWAHAIFLSTNPGLPEGAEKKARALADGEWARRFQTENWDSLMDSWNSQGVLRESAEPPRNENNYDRRTLAEILNHWSLASQEDQRPLIAQHARKLDWIVGARDEKFVKIARGMKTENSALNVEVVADASHRIFFDQPEACASLLVEQIKKAVSL